MTLKIDVRTYQSNGRKADVRVIEDLPNGSADVILGLTGIEIKAGIEAINSTLKAALNG